MQVKNIDFSYNDNEFIKNLSVSFKENCVTSIIGPNGSGKSTLLLLISRVLKMSSGSISINDRDIWEYKLKDFAKYVAVVHQKNGLYSDLDVETVIGYGRLPYLGYTQRLTEDDYKIIDEVIDVTNLSEYRKRRISTLSGGQQQRVWIAMALAQKTPILLLDEPTTYLDVKYQIEILNLVRDINRKSNITIIMVHHDINQAINYSDEIVAMKDGKILFQGPPNDTITSESLKELYSHELEVLHHEEKKIVLNYQVR